MQRAFTHACSRGSSSHTPLHKCKSGQKVHTKRTERRNEWKERNGKDLSTKNTNLLFSPILRRRRRLQWPLSFYNLLRLLHTVSESETEIHVLQLWWQGWPSGESTCLPPMWPWFEFSTRCHMWIELVGSLLCHERFFPGTPVFPSHHPKNQHFI